MADAMRLRIMKALTAVIERATVANGFKHDLTERVFRGRLFYGDKDPVPMVSILETPLQPATQDRPPDSTEQSDIWELVIQGWADDDAKNPTDSAYNLAADVRKTLADEKVRASHRTPSGPPANDLLGLGRDVLNIKIGQPVCRPPDDLSAKAYFWITIRLTLAEDLSNPYAE